MPKTEGEKEQPSRSEVLSEGGAGGWWRAYHPFFSDFYTFLKRGFFMDKQILSSLQYATKHKITVKTVYNRIAKGLLYSQKLNNKIYVCESPFDVSDLEVLNSKKKIENRFDLAVSKHQWEVKKNELQLILQKQKLKNLRADTLLKNQKVLLKKEEYKKQICNKIFDVYSNSFSSLKGCIIDLRLNEHQINAFICEMEKCLEKFRQGLEEYCRVQQIEQEQENEENEI